MNSSDPAAVPPSGGTPPLDWVREAGKVELLLQDIQAKLGRRRRRRAAVGSVASALLVAAGVFLGVPYVRDTDAVNNPAAQRQIIALMDGSSAELNAQTEIHTDFRYGRRTIALERGEAFFSVTKDAEHPFFVETPAGTVRVLGTQFNVRLDERGETIVTLLEGRVEFSPRAAPAVVLAPSQQIDSAAPTARTLDETELGSVTAWREGRLVLDGLTLEQAAARLASYHGKRISVASEISGLRMGGSCSLEDLPGFLEFLPRALSVRVETQLDGSVRVSAR